MSAVTSTSLAVLRRLTTNGTARRLRQDAGLSLADVAKDVGVGAPTILRWETGQRVPRGDRALRYADVLADLASTLSGLQEIK